MDRPRLDYRGPYPSNRRSRRPLHARQAKTNITPRPCYCISHSSGNKRIHSDSGIAPEIGIDWKPDAWKISSLTLNSSTLTLALRKLN
ncbi:hypothetical protein AVEN_103634-1 [Araneus ventricosus]|uniref:Uncharacterized protein n=1 Tax=Araneus ventricosus TaxID=182803 RepID=A0A4Y2HBG9_ARAVE|nr:hypothetical protein AVEN_103634-1 [Araneus ventricosus]